MNEDEESPQSQPPKWRLGAVVLGIAVSVFCLWLAVRDVEWAKIPPAFAAADYRTLPLIGLLLIVFFWTKAMRWAALLRPLPRGSEEPFTAASVLPATLIGFAGNNVLPAHAGEFFRVAVVAKRWNTPAAGVLSTVVLERVLDVGAILALFAVSLPFVPGAGDEYGGFVWLAAGCLGAAALGCGVFLWKTEAFVGLVGRLLNLIPLLPDGLKRGVPTMLGQAARGLDALRSGPTLLGVAAV
ncbi:MAG: lysylphosphatidylglycerol synthase transmembrane domain-containing protein, partial [Planctomycetota bacterium]